MITSILAPGDNPAYPPMSALAGPVWPARAHNGREVSPQGTPSLDDDLADAPGKCRVRVGREERVGHQHVDLLNGGERRQADHPPL